MKKNLIVFLLFSNFIYSQNSLDVQITGDCSEVAGIYDYVGSLNGKNQYSKSFIIQTVPIIMNIRFDGLKWILWANSTPTESGFKNTNVNSSLFPPLIGWQNDACSNGTLNIIEVLSTNQFENNKISISPCPTSEYIIIHNKERQNESLNFKILDMTGRTIKTDKTKYNKEIDLTELTAGKYFVEIQDENENIFHKKIIKK